MRLIVFLLFPFFVTAQDVYYVVRVQGVIKRATDKEKVKPGDQFLLVDSLLYSTSNDYLVAIGKKGSYTAKFRNDLPRGKTNEFIAAVGDLLFPAVTTKFTQTRNGFIKTLFELETYLHLFSNEGNTLLMVDSVKIPLMKTNILLNRDHFFVVHYQYNGGTIAKKLGLPRDVKDTGFLFADEKLYSIDGKPIDPSLVNEIEVLYRDEIKQESTMLGLIHLRFIKRTPLVSELREVKEGLLKLNPGNHYSQAELTEGVIDYMLTYYGVPDERTSGSILADVFEKKVHSLN